MRIIAVDDERLALNNIVALLKQVMPEAEICGFTKSLDAFAWLSAHSADIAFLDIEMGEMNGISLAKRCKDLCPGINIIFITGYDQYTMDALRLHASGYLMKPVRAEDLYIELDNLRYPIPVAPTHRVRIQTFGNFEIFVDSQPLKFPLTKCRECLAYLVDRKGALVTVSELASVLWEDKPLDHSLRNFIHQVIFALTKTLKAVHANDILIKRSREIAIDPSKVDCDYYRALSGDVGQLNLFAGEYMNNYSWAEITVGGLLNLKEKL